MVLLGWKAIPFAREDLDSNFVNIPDEACILATGSGGGKPLSLGHGQVAGEGTRANGAERGEAVEIIGREADIESSM
jgi:hypothetical protein